MGHLGAGRLRRVFAVSGAVLSVAISIAGCGSAKQAKAPQADAMRDSIVLYNADDGRLEYFDPSDADTTPVYSGNQIVQYPFPDEQGLYTSGSSENGHFKIIRVVDNRIENVLQVSKCVGLLPLAHQGDLTLLVRSYCDGRYHVLGGTRWDQVVRLSGTRLVPVKKLDVGGVLSGTVLKGTLYYSWGQSMGAPVVFARAIPIDRLGTSVPATVGKWSSSPNEDVDSFDGHLVLGDYVQTGRGRGRYIDCDEYCLFPSGRPFAISETSPQGNLESKVTVENPLSGKVFGTVQGEVVGFIVSARVVTVWTVRNGRGVAVRVPVP